MDDQKDLQSLRRTRKIQAIILDADNTFNCILEAHDLDELNAQYAKLLEKYPAAFILGIYSNEIQFVEQKQIRFL